MDMDKYKNAPGAVTIEEAAKISGIPAEWVAAKIDSGLPAYIVDEDSRLGLLSSLIPCEDEPTSLQDYYLATRNPRTSMKPYLISCQYTLADGTFIEEYLTDFDAIRILKKDLLKPVKQAARMTGARPPTKRKAPTKKDYRNAKHTFMDDALLAYFTKNKKDPNTISDLIKQIKTDMTNKEGDTA